MRSTCVSIHHLRCERVCPRCCRRTARFCPGYRLRLGVILILRPRERHADSSCSLQATRRDLRYYKQTRARCASGIGAPRTPTPDCSRGTMTNRSIQWPHKRASPFGTLLCAFCRLLQANFTFSVRKYSYMHLGEETEGREEVE